jgi:hypothetical protein
VTDERKREEGKEEGEGGEDEQQRERAVIRAAQRTDTDTERPTGHGADPALGGRDRRAGGGNRRRLVMVGDVLAVPGAMPRGARRP